MQKSFLISGAGSGIGKAIALKIAEASATNKVFLLGRNEDKLEAVRKGLPRSEIHQVLKADICNKQDLHQNIKRANLEKENLVAVISNAGIGGGNEFGPDDRWDEIIETNLTGTYRLVEECLPALRASKEKYKNIVVTSSILAHMGVPKYTAYCASKAGLLGLVKSWAVELAQEGILANAICPGWVSTDMAEQGISALAKDFNIPYDQAFKAQMKMVPLGKMSEPQEVASLVYFLVGSEQSSMTGQAIDMNNGALMR